MDNKYLINLAKISDILDKTFLKNNTEINVKLNNNDFLKLKHEIENQYKKIIIDDTIIVNINNIKFIINKNNV
jgi:hypothetical protein